MNWPTSVVRLLQALIQIPSVNPEGDPGYKETGEAALAAYVGKLLEEIGAKVTFQEALPGRPNVLASFSSSTTGKPRLLFAPHLDTVSVRGMTVSPFDGEIRDGKVWGRGASDTKGPMAAMLWALYKVGERIFDLPWEIWFAGLADEETRQCGSRTLAAKEKFDFAIVGEPTDMRVIHKTKGCLCLKIRTKGRAAHSSSPEQGENAVWKMLDVLKWVQENVVPRLSLATCTELGSSSLNLGQIQGGVRHNIVPDFCEATLDIRTVPRQNTADLIEMFRTTWPELEMEYWESLPLEAKTHHPIVQQLLAAGLQLGSASWVCDATSFAAMGTSAIALGPGSTAQAHTVDEFIEISALEKGTMFFESFLGNLSNLAISHHSS